MMIDGGCATRVGGMDDGATLVKIIRGERSKKVWSGVQFGEVWTMFSMWYLWHSGQATCLPPSF